ncbi:MAG: dihydrofolate reductase [Gemmatimonas sp.]|nr:dihydrofolate reductase [Gemmatimonas sp.]
MRRVRYNVAASLDGYIATAAGGYDWIPQDSTVDFAALFAKVDTVLLGRHSYRAAKQAGETVWPAGSRVFVFSTTLRPEEHPDVTIVNANADTVVANLRTEPGDGDIWLFGGGQLFSRLLVAGQVDCVEVTIAPMLLGGGIPLSASGAPEVQLTLEGTTQYPSGMVTLNYHVRGTSR